MSRVSVIEGAINTYCAGMSLPTTHERVREMAEYIDNHLATYAPGQAESSEAVLTLRMVKALIDEAFISRAGSTIPLPHPDEFKPS